MNPIDRTCFMCGGYGGFYDPTGYKNYVVRKCSTCDGTGKITVEEETKDDPI